MALEGLLINEIFKSLIKKCTNWLNSNSDRIFSSHVLTLKSEPHCKYDMNMNKLNRGILLNQCKHLVLDFYDDIPTQYCILSPSCHMHEVEQYFT